MTTPTLTAADLHRLVTAPWCPLHGFDLSGHGTDRLSSICAITPKPNLWERAFETRPNTLEWRESLSRNPSWQWWVDNQPITHWTAALLALGKLVEAVPTDELTSFWMNVQQIESINGVSRHHAAVAAFHQWKDSQDQEPEA